MLEARIGGLYRCCIMTLERADDAGKLEGLPEGSKIKCCSCGDMLRLRDGAWEWTPADKEDNGGVEGL